MNFLIFNFIKARNIKKNFLHNKIVDTIKKRIFRSIIKQVELFHFVPTLLIFLQKIVKLVKACVKVRRGTFDFFFAFSSPR